MSLADDFPLIDDGQDFGPRCVECGKAQSSIVGGDRIYSHRPDLAEKSFWLCPCGAYCGCHPGTEDPLGFPAGPTTRRIRSRVHAKLNPLWRSAKQRHKTRNQVYLFLAHRMEIERDACHVGMFTAEQCAQALTILDTWEVR